MDDAIKEPQWLAKLEKRLRPHVAHAREYIARHNHGIPGHIHLVTINALAQQLDAAEAQIATLEQHRRLDDYYATQIAAAQVAEVEAAADALRKELADLRAEYGGAS